MRKYFYAKCPKCGNTNTKWETKIILVNESCDGYFVQYGTRCIAKNCNAKLSLGNQWHNEFPKGLEFDKEYIHTYILK